MARIRIYSGILIDPFNPKPEDIIPEDIIHSLALINRFHGNTEYPYPVAQHSYVLAKNVPKHLVRAAIVHDWSESWFNDLASPIKIECKAYKKAEKNACSFIMKHMGISKEEHIELDHYDKAIFLDERDALFNDVIGVGMGDKRSKLGIDPSYFKEQSWRESKENLLNLYKEEFGV
jgi:hypothetical protein